MHRSVWIRLSDHFFSHRLRHPTAAFRPPPSDCVNSYSSTHLLFCQQKEGQQRPSDLIYFSVFLTLVLRTLLRTLLLKSGPRRSGCVGFRSVALVLSGCSRAE